MFVTTTVTSTLTEAAATVAAGTLSHSLIRREEDKLKKLFLLKIKLKITKKKVMEKKKKL